VYGGLNDPETLFSETTAYATSFSSSVNKASADHLVCAWHRTYGQPAVVANCPKITLIPFPEKHIPLIILNALEGKLLQVCARGNQVRDCLYVEDYVRALLVRSMYYCSCTSRIFLTHDLRYAIDASNTQRELGSTQEKTFNSGICKTVEWNLNSLEWCCGILGGCHQHKCLGEIV
jgi:dTDP-glucose 4,6-dehydratase